VDVIGGIALKHSVLCDQTAGTFSEKDLVAKLDRFLYFPPLDQIGVGFKDRVDLLLGCNLLSLKSVFRSNRPPNPEQSGRVIRAKAAGGRSEATLEFFS
jgi:hypothetical protein